MKWYLMQYFANMIFSFVVLYKPHNQVVMLSDLQQLKGKWVRTLEGVFLESCLAMPIKGLLCTRGWGLWRCPADLGLPECCYRSATFIGYGLGRDREGRKTCLLAGNFEYRVFLLHILILHPEMVRWEGQKHDYQDPRRLIFKWLPIFK